MSAGEQLRAAREARKASFADVARETKIQRWIIEALEQDHLPEMMNPVYARGFLATYAKWLKLDPAPLLAAAPPIQPPVPEPAEVLPPPKPAVEQPAIRVPTRLPLQLPAWKLSLRWPALPRVALPRVRLPRFALPSLSLPTFSLPPLPWMRRMLQIAPAVALVALMIVGLRSYRPSPTAEAPAKPVKTAKAPAKPAEQAAKPAKPVEQTAKPAPAAEVRVASIAPVKEMLPATPPPVLETVPTQSLDLNIRIQRATWVQVRADGKLLAQGRLDRGRDEFWKAKEQLELIVADPSRVEILLNGQPITPFAVSHRGRLLITRRGITALPADNR